MKNKLFLLFICLSVLTATKTQGQDFDEIVNDIDTINGTGAPGLIFPIDTNVVPLVSGDIHSSEYNWQVYSVATNYYRGRVLAIGHEGMFTDENIVKNDNRKFFLNAISWLNPGEKNVMMKNGWLNNGNTNILKSELINRGYTITFANDEITSDDLINIDIIFFGNDWNNDLPYSEAEVEVIRSFVENGGGVFITGLGWSPSNLDNYAMNSISKAFGFLYIRGCIGTPYLTEFYPSIEKLNTLISLHNLKKIVKEHSTDLSYVLQNNGTVRKLFTKSNVFLYEATQYLSDESSLRDSIYDTYTKIIPDYPILFQKSTVYDNISETSIIWNRERMYKNLCDSKALTDDIIEEIGTTLGLTDKYLEIWGKHHVLLLDNSKLDDRQLKFSSEILNWIPSDIYKLGSISFSDFLGNTNKLNLDGRIGCVNSFSTPVDHWPENQFPNDVTPGITGIFCAALAHEINHNVNAFYIDKNLSLKKRQTQLLSQAGTIALNYLRNGSETGYMDFFINSPQEFFASIANQWFANSEKALELGLIRLNNNYKEPINQFLYFADVYSTGKDSTTFYSNDIDGNFSYKKVPITRDNRGHVNSIKINNILYNFELDANGNVQDYSCGIVSGDTTTYFVSSQEFQVLSPRTFINHTETFTSVLGIDSIYNHYIKFVYNPVYYSDTTYTTILDTTHITQTDSVMVAVTDTLFINVTLTGNITPDLINVIKVYPNPAHNYLIINTGNYALMIGYTVTIRNIEGQLVYQTLLNQTEISIDVNTFGGYGTYILELTDQMGKLVTNRKIILH